MSLDDEESESLESVVTVNMSVFREAPWLMPPSLKLFGAQAGATTFNH